MPSGGHAGHQWWGKLLFMHWPISVELLRPLVPSVLEIDTFEGHAWIAVVPFTMWGIRPRFVPTIPYLSQAHELNVRTYVHYNGFPGVWFLSLDINQWPGVFVGRYGFHVPYYKADITLKQEQQTIDYDLVRTQGPKRATYNASWTIGDALPEASAESLESFLTERYCLYATNGDKLYRSRIWHNAWPLQKATVHNYRTTTVEAMGLPTPTGDPLLHYAESLSVRIWLPERLI